jgi:hypothetical protein
MKELDLIQTFEDTFIKAGKLATSLRKEATIESKFDSGEHDVDIVTSSDIAVQEFVLSELAKSDLNQLELVAEEDTPSIHKFAKHADLVLTIDPIDGTANYAKGGDGYNIIVSIHDKVRPIYTFRYIPEKDWGQKIVGDKAEFFGEKPHYDFVKKPKVITYPAYFGVDPKNEITELYEQLVGEGYTFVDKKKVFPDTGATTQFLLEMVDGFFSINGSPVDNFVALHYGLAKGYKIYRDLDLSHLAPSKHGGIGHYEGWYVVLKNSEVCI